MRESLIQIGLSRLYSIRDRAKELVLKDIKENTLLDELSRFTDKLMNLDRSSFTDFQKRELCYDIEIAIGWFNALIDNENTRLSKSILELLKQISRDWIDTYDNRVFLVTVGDYATQARAKELNDRFGKEYHFSFTMLPLILYVPPHLSDDLFLGVALLHEIGHMIDFELDISYLVEYLIKSGKTPIRISDADCSPYFSDLKSIDRSHLEEYFADIFGAQYSGESILANVDYRTVYPTQSSMTHPSYENRLSAVSDFVKNNSTKNYSSKIITLMAFVMEVFKNKPLRIQTVTIDESSFDNDEPIQFSSPAQLSSIFYNSWVAFEKGPHTFDRYARINSIALRSLDNHFGVS